MVSATALHWLGVEELSALYSDIPQVLRAGGIFLNADHVGGEHSQIQQVCEGHRETMRRQEGSSRADDWDGFFEAYGKALRIDIGDVRQKAIGEYRGNEEGMPLTWHFARLKANGFRYVDCFWRCDCDAIYGGILGS